MMTLKEATVKQFEYCKAIAEDILKHEKSIKVQEYASLYAEIESRFFGIDVDWIRICWGDIYIFLHDNGTIDYQLDPHGEYGGELIDVQSEKEFWELFDKISEEQLVVHHCMMYEDGDYSIDCPREYKPMV